MSDQIYAILSSPRAVAVIFAAAVLVFYFVPAAWRRRQESRQAAAAVSRLAAACRPAITPSADPSAPTEDRTRSPT